MKDNDKNRRAKGKMPWDSVAVPSAWKKGEVASRPASYYRMMERCLRRDMEVSTVLGRETVVDVLLPLGESEEDLGRLLEQIDRTNVSYQILFLDDRCSSEAVLSFAETYIAGHSFARIIHNERKIGIVASLNRGLVISRAEYVVLMGAEVTLPENWLERLVMPLIKDPTVASVTPFTNHGLLAGFPVPNRRNRLFDDEPVENTDRIFQKIRSLYTTVPYGVGFCMAMNREVIHKIGILDQQNYRELDGADIDWALRAARAGYRNVVAENLYVKNDRFSTEMLEGERMLSRKQEIILLREKPEYREAVEKFEQEDPLTEIRAFAFSMLISERCSRCRVIFHEEGLGSADTYMRRYIEDKLNENEAVMTVQFRKNRFVGVLEYDCYRVGFSFGNLDEVLKLAENMNSRRIIIGRIVGFPDTMQMLQAIRRYSDTSGSRLVIMLLDYFCVCPGSRLYTTEGKNCRPLAGNCAECRSRWMDAENCGFRDAESWKNDWKDFVRDVHEVLYYSEDLLKAVESVLGTIDQSHKMVKPSAGLSPVSRIRKRTGTVNVFVPGPLYPENGLDFVTNLCKQAEKEKSNIHFYIRGLCERKLPRRYATVVPNDGDTKLTGFLLEHDIDMALLADAVPDPIGMRAEKLTELGIPVLYRNIGENGYVLSRSSNGKEIRTICSDALKDIQTLAKSTMPPKADGFHRVQIFCQDPDSESVRSLQEWLWKHGVNTAAVTPEEAFGHRSTTARYVLVEGLPYSRRLRFLLEEKLHSGASVWVLIHRREEVTEENMDSLSSLCTGFLADDRDLAAALRTRYPQKPVHLVKNRWTIYERKLSYAIMNENQGRDRLHLYADSYRNGRPEEAFTIGWLHDGGKEARFTQEACMKVISELEGFMRRHPNVRLLVSDRIMLDRDKLKLREHMLPVNDETKKDRWMILSQCDVVLKPMPENGDPLSESEKMAGMAGIPVVRAGSGEIAAKLERQMKELQGDKK